MRVLEEGWKYLFREADTPRHGPVALDAGKGAEPLLSPHAAYASCAALYRAQLARHRQHDRQHHRSTIVSCRWLVTSWSCCHGRDVLLHRNVLCDCGKRELHRLPTSPLRWWNSLQLFDTAVHGVNELAKTLSPITASGGPPNTTCADTWPLEQESCRLFTAPLETGVLLQSSTPPRSSTNNERGERGALLA